MTKTNPCSPLGQSTFVIINCFDTEIDYWRRGYKCSSAEYLNTIKFPDPKAAPGPSIRAGDFAEVLVADFLESDEPGSGQINPLKSCGTNQS